MIWPLLGLEVSTDVLREQKQGATGSKDRTALPPALRGVLSWATKKRHSPLFFCPGKRPRAWPLLETRSQDVLLREVCPKA